MNIKSTDKFVFSALHTHHVHLVCSLDMYVHTSYICTHLLHTAGSTGRVKKRQIKTLRGMAQYQSIDTETRVIYDQYFNLECFDCIYCTIHFCYGTSHKKILQSPRGERC